MTTRFEKLLFTMLAVLFAACSNEVQQKDGTEPLPDDGDGATTPRREVFLALQNKLILANAPSTKGEEVIATAAENAISTLDVYVFGSETEDGEYSFQERFAYRANPEDKLPKGASELQLSTTGNDGKESTALLKLKKGLFIKLYCIANDTTLIDPSNNQMVKETFFQPLTFTTPGQTGTKIQEPGVPSEDVFTSFHTRLLSATVKSDTLVTPLAMVGAYTTPLDLTNFENSARVQAAFRLTRLSSRIDIINDAKDSRFTIESISMGHGRRGSQYFPIRVYGDTPQAQPDEIITYPIRAFGDEDANKGLTTGAFYCYPSPQEDEAFLILKGQYKVNETEMKPVSYQVPFVQQRPDGTATQLAVVNNHRYTVAITEADEYHLDAVISVEDWADDGSVEYEPDNKPGEISVKIADAFVGDSEYDEKTRTVSMSLKDGSSFEITISSNSALHLNKVYAGGPAGQLDNWLKISEPQVITRSALYTYKYTVELVKPYLKGRYPRATLRFTTAADASEQLLFVEAISVPQPIETPQPPKAPNGTSPNPNSFNPELLSASVFRITDSRAQIKITCPDGLEVESKPDWLEVVQAGQSGSVYTFDVTLTDRDVKDTQGVIVFHNAKRPELKTEVTVNLEETPVIPDYTSLGTENAVKPGTPATETTPAVPDDVTLVIKEDNSATVKVKSMDGVSVKIDYPAGSPEWLSYTGASASSTKAAVETADSTVTIEAVTKSAKTGKSVTLKSQDIEFIPVKSKLAGAQQATVTLNNNIGGKEYVFTITPKLLPVVVSKGKEASVPIDDVLKGDVITLYQLSGAHKESSQMQLSAFALGGSVLSIEGDGATISPAQNTANEANYILKPALPDGTDKATVTLHAKNYTDQTQQSDYTVNVLRADVTGDKAATLTATAGQTVSFKASSYEGFTIDKKTIQWQPEGESGGAQWFNIAITEFDAGKDKTIALTAIATAASAQIRPATITLKNNIINGGDLKVVITPAYAAPMLTAVSADPTQNTLVAAATASTMNLYQVSNSTMTIKATAIGGSKFKDLNGVTVTGGDSYNTENTYKVTLVNGAKSGSFKIVNKSDESKVQTITVNAPAATMTAANITSLNVAVNQTGTSAVKSPEGFQASVNWNGGNAWFDLTGGDTNNNYTKTATQVGVKVKSNLNNIGNIKAATVTMTNKIRGGASVTFTVTPTLAAPTGAVVANTASPTQNTYDNNATVKLYRVTNSKLNINVTAIGGTKLISQSGVTVSGGNNYNTTATYTITLNNNSTGGSFVIANNSDQTKQKTFTVQAPVTTITRNAASQLLVTNNNQTVSNTVSSPEGFTTSVNWNGGAQWFTLNSTTFNKGNQTVTATMKNDLSNVTIKAATVTLSNKISGGATATYTVTPDFQAPVVTMVSNTANRLEGTTVKMVKNTSNSNLNSTITLRAVATGGTRVSVTSGLSVTTATSSNNLSTDYIIKVAYNASQSSGTITFSNNSKTDKQTRLNVTITNLAVTYPDSNEPCFEVGNFWVGPVSYTPGNMNQTKGSCPEGWRVPTNDEYISFVNNNLNQIKAAFPYVANRTYAGYTLYLSSTPAGSGYRVMRVTADGRYFAGTTEDDWYNYVRPTVLRCIKNK